jgi:hypothetical protein
MDREDGDEHRSREVLAREVAHLLPRFPYALPALEVNRAIAPRGHKPMSGSRRRAPRPEAEPRGAPELVYMLVDRLTGEALREGDDPRDSGPLFFTSEEKLHAYAREEAVEEYTVHALPAGILARMRGRPHWVDGERR